MTFTDLVTLETWTAQFRPEQLTAKLDPVYSELEILGGSATVDQFRHTKSLSIEIELYFDCLAQKGWTAATLDDAERFLSSLAYPVRGDTPGQGKPPNVLFVWPKVYSVVARVGPATWTKKRSASTGPFTLATAKLELRQVLSIRRTSDDVRARGFR